MGIRQTRGHFVCIYGLNFPAGGRHKKPRQPPEGLKTGKSRDWACRNAEELWRRDRDSNPGRALTLAGFQDQCMGPLCHPSGFRSGRAAGTNQS